LVWARDKQDYFFPFNQQTQIFYNIKSIPGPDLDLQVCIFGSGLYILQHP